MIRFRSSGRTAEPPAALETVTQVAQLIGDTFQLSHFLTAENLPLTWSGPETQEISWEIFRGRLLTPAQTRQRRAFTAWNLYWTYDSAEPVHPPGETPFPAEPLLSVKLDQTRSEIHVVRGILCHAWEAYGGSVIESREVVKWVRELVGTIAWRSFRTLDELRDELIGLLFHAVVGTSRLPLHSLEAPLPSFSLGQLAYFYRPRATTPLTGWTDWIDQGLTPDLSWRERAKFLEFLLRAVSRADVAAVARRFTARWQDLCQTPKDLLALLRTVFNEISLSPYTDFIDKTLAFLRVLVADGYVSMEEQADFLSLLLRQLGRHLTAYDLITFHYRGANYPDALFLDDVLKELLWLATRHQQLFGDHNERARLRRRAVRQACLFRYFYEGHQVPDVPTSPGENARVLPVPLVRVPEDQLLQTTKRRRQLFVKESLGDILGAHGKAVLQQAVDDLHHPAELRELGTAVFIDRPLGMWKKPGEADQTPLLAHETFSRAMAAQRLHELARLAVELGVRFDRDAAVAALHQLAVAGLPVSEVAAPDRPTVSLADALRVSQDFVVVRTLPGGLKELWRLYEWTAHGLAELKARGKCVVACVPSSAGTVLAVFDDRYRKRVELEIDAAAGYEARAGIELPAPGLRVLRVWREIAGDGELHAVAPQSEWLVAAGRVYEPRG